MIKNFSLKFIDIMVGIVLGLGFQWWPALVNTWQYLAFIFVYLDIVDYWIDYGPTLKKWPPKREIDVLLDVSIMFSMFLYIYTTQTNIIYFLSAFSLLKILDFFWLFSSKIEYRPTGVDKTYLDTWLMLNSVEILFTLVIISIFIFSNLSPLAILLLFIFVRILIRIIASFKYKKVHFV